MSSENRSFCADGMEMRTAQNGVSTLHGYAAVYDSPSVDLGNAIEYVRRSAFTRTLRDVAEGRNVVRARVQHMGGLHTIGSTQNGTLRLLSDSHGLKYECDLPDTSAGRDIGALVARGDINRSSFAFQVHGDAGERWNFRANPPTRELLDVDLRDVAPVDDAAYPATLVEARSAVRARINEVQKMKTETANGGVSCEVRTDSDGARVVDLSIMGEITSPRYAWLDDSYVSAAKVRAALNAVEGVDRINLDINSPGGDAFEGIAIYNLLKDHPAPVHVRVVGLAASAASIVAMAGDVRSMRAGAMIMVHRASSYVYGNMARMREIAMTLEAIDGQIADIYAANTNESRETWLTLMDAETWMTGEESIARGAATATVSVDAEHRDFSAAFARMECRNAPEQYRVPLDTPRTNSVYEYRQLLKDALR